MTCEVPPSTHRNQHCPECRRALRRNRGQESVRRARRRESATLASPWRASDKGFRSTTDAKTMSRMNWCVTQSVRAEAEAVSGLDRYHRCRRAWSSVDRASASGAEPPERCGHPNGTPSETGGVLRSSRVARRESSIPPSSTQQPASAGRLRDCCAARRRKGIVRAGSYFPHHGRRIARCRARDR